MLVAPGTAATIINSENDEANEAAHDEKQHHSACIDLGVTPKCRGKKSKRPKKQ